jgi:protein-disulfide isomerase
VLPGLTAKFINTGKVRFVFREFPRDNLDAAVYMLARCLDSSKYMPFVGVMFENQEKWAFAEGDPVARLLEFAKQAGFTEDSFKKCLSDQALLDKLLAGRERAVDVFKVNSTPTLFVNGIRFEGDLAELEGLLAKLGVN